MQILFLTYESWPTHRPDVVTIFGKYLRRRGIRTDLVAEASECGQPLSSSWEGGKLIMCARPKRRAAQHIAKLWLNIKTVFSAKPGEYDCIQVRDMSLSALAGLCAARLKGIKFVYWLSFLQSEGHIMRARARGPGAGIKYWYPLFEGMIGRFIVYKLVLPRADHVFVQSDAMKARLAGLGIPADKMTPVPMGVDLEEVDSLPATLPSQAGLAGRRPIVYLGTQDRVRQIEVLLHMLARIKTEVPEVLLIMVGDTADESYRSWLREEAARLGVEQYISWTGWVSRAQAWGYMRSAEVGLSPVPRGEINDTSSPTKPIEYMAFGIPVVGNDIPDQKIVIEQSGAGICTSLDPDHMANAVITLLRDERLRTQMGQAGPGYVSSFRAYSELSANLAGVYERVLGVAIARSDESLPV